MTLARYESDATDDAGNLLANVTVEVRLESGGLASIYSDRAGTVPLANPFNDADGHIGFHVAGGAYKITFTQGVISRIRRYVAIGLSAETDFPVPTFVPTPGDFCDVAVFEQGLCQNGELLHRQEFTSTVVFPAGLPLSRFSAGVPASTPVAFTFAKNGTAFGTANFAGRCHPCQRCRDAAGDARYDASSERRGHTRLRRFPRHRYRRARHHRVEPHPLDLDRQRLGMAGLRHCRA
jgi:hypothetical protein